MSGKAAARHLKRTLKESRKELRAAADDIDWEFDRTNPEAIQWAKDHAAELVQGLSKVDREAVRDLVEDAFEEQFDVDELSDRIADIIGDEARAETIARTETMKASNMGQQLAWDDATEHGLLTGFERKQWITTPDDRLCPVCEPMDGVTVGMDEMFDVEGAHLEGPPAHPNCRCAIGLTA